MNRCTLTYGTQTIELDVPKSAMATKVIRPSVPPSKMSDDDITDAIRAAIANPVEGKKLAELAAGKSVTVVVSDEFRAGYREHLLKAAMEELSRANPSRIVVICGTGTHDPAVYAKHVEGFAHQAAKDVGLTIEFIGHSCDDPKLVDVGRTPMGSPLSVEPAVLEADVVVLLHESKVHYMNGYSLPDKLILPGVSARKTVEANHKRALDAEHSVGGNSPYHSDPAISHNPFSEDTRDARKMIENLKMDSHGVLTKVAKPVFTVDMLSDTGYVHCVFAGPVDPVIQKIIPEIDRTTAFEVDRSDCVVISPGGPPACNALYGVQNCFDLSLKGAIKEGGDALIIAPCKGRADLPSDVSGLAPDANSKALFWDNLLRLLGEDISDAERWIDKNFQLYLWKTDRMLKLVKHSRIKLYLYSELDPKILNGSPFIPVTSPQSWIDERANKGLSFNVVDSGNKILVRGRG